MVLGLCDLKTLRKRKKASGLKGDIYDPLETSNLSLMKKAVS